MTITYPNMERYQINAMTHCVINKRFWQVSQSGRGLSGRFVLASPPKKSGYRLKRCVRGGGDSKTKRTPALC